MQTLTLFVSSTGDVRDERLAVGAVVEKWQARYHESVRLEILTKAPEASPVEPVTPAECDAWICILGSPLRPREERDVEMDARSFGGDSILLCYRHGGGPADEGKKIDAFHRRAFSNREGTVFGSAEDFTARFGRDLEELLTGRFGPAPGRSMDGPPYPGARVFDYDDARRFYGRDRPIAEALAQLKANHAAGHGFLLIYGDGSTGKSSMMRAGLAPRLTADGHLPEVGAWCGTTLLPVEDDAAPLETLARAIAGALPELEKIRDTSRPAGAVKTARKKKGRKSKAVAKAEPVWDRARLAGSLGQADGLVFAVTAIVAALDRVSAGKPAQLLVLVDQLELIFDGASAGERDDFFRALAALVRSRRVWVVATLDSSFFPRVAEHRDLFQLVRRGGGFFLGPPDEDETRSIIRGPALAAGLDFESGPEGDLSAEILRDATVRHDFLPLLGTALEKLHERRRDPLLTWDAYREIGGLGGRIRKPTAPKKPARGGRGRRQAAALLCAGLAAGVLGMALMRPAVPVVPVVAPVTENPDRSLQALAAADFKTGVERIAAGAPQEALPYLVASLEKQPDDLDTQALLLGTLRTARWSFPVAELEHPLAVSRLAFGADGGTLFAATDAGKDGVNTTLRWHLPDATIAALLKPTLEGETRDLSVAPGGQRVIVRRGEMTLLCDAGSLMPVTSLAMAADAPGACIAWTPKGLLVAYPVETEGKYSWVIADAATGAAVRESAPVDAGAPLSAALDQGRLTATHRDGTKVELPLNPDEPVVVVSGEVPASVAGGPREVTAAAPDGSRFAVATPAGRVTVNEWLAAPGHEWGEPDAEPAGAPLPRVERRDGGFQFVTAEGEAVALLPPARWEEITGAAMSPDGTRVALAGEGRLPGIALADPATGDLVGEVLPLDGVARLDYLPDGRLVAATSREVRILDPAGDRFEKVAVLPVAGAFDFHAPPGSGWVAIAAGNEVALYRTEDFSRLATLPLGDAAGAAGEWAADQATGWLAFRSADAITVWSTRAACELLRLDPPPGAGIAFVEKDGMRGLKAGARFLPLAKNAGIGKAEADELKAFSRALGGVMLDEEGRSVVRLSRDERRAALQRDFDRLPGLFPRADPLALRDAVLTLPFSSSGPEAWLPLWERLAMVPGVDEGRLIRWSSTAGDHPWFRQYLRGRIARSDVDLNLAWQGEEVAREEVSWMHRLAGDPAEISELKRASWLASDPRAEGREAALDMLEVYAEATRQACEAEDTAANALAHAEALAWRGDPEKAADFLKDRLADDAELSLEQAHFLVSFGLDAGALLPSLERLGSPWLWRQWLQAGAGGEPLATAVERVMNAVDGRGPAAVEALWISLADADPAAIAACLKAAKDLPEALARHAAGAALWAEGKKAAAFALWPEGFPDLEKAAAEGDWNGWEGALPAQAENLLYAGMEEELAALEVPPDGGVEEWTALAKRLLDPETTATFGPARVRDAMMSCALYLSADPGSYELVVEMVERARLAGAPPSACQRAEARAYMAAGQFSLAYARWLELIESGDADITPRDYLDASRCVIEDMQDAAAIELLTRGMHRFPGDSAYASAAAWLLITSNHPEEAGVLLEHGFGIPFNAEEMQTATAMLVCAAELTLRAARADEACRELFALDPAWGDDASLDALEWPDWLKQTLRTVVERNR